MSKPGELLIDLWFPGKPFGKARARFTKLPHSGAYFIHDPDDTDDNPIKFYPLKDIFITPYPPLNDPKAKAVALAATRQIEAANMAVQMGGVRVDWCAFFQPVKSDPPKERMDKARGNVCYTKKPDKDNIAKMIFDALNCKAWLDDNQVCIGTGAKVYYHVKEGIRVKIYKADPQQILRWHTRNFPWPDDHFTLSGK